MPSLMPPLGRTHPKGRQLEATAATQLPRLLAGLPQRRDLLIEYLHRLQDSIGYLPSSYLKALADWLGLAQVEVYEVASFYAHFDVVHEGQLPPPPITLRVCTGLSCQLAGGAALQQQLQQQLAATADGASIRIVEAPCMGRCATPPTVNLKQYHIDRATTAQVQQALANRCYQAQIPPYESLAAYRQRGGYQALSALRNGQYSATELLARLAQAHLRGLGGAGFPAAKKWQAVLAEPAPRYLAVNADEGEPGTFKDRYLLERQPHQIMEGILLAAEVIGAERIYLYVRDEYPAIRALLATELTALIAAKLVPETLIELRRGAGAYICGEESAMIESIEGKRGLPRQRPPFVAQQGLWGRPTLEHNIETLYWVSRIANEGAECFLGRGPEDAVGLRHYSVSGRVMTPGVYLLPTNATIMEVIAAAGGMADGHQFYAYQPGGPSSGLLPASLDSVPLDFDGLAQWGSLIGSAAVVVLSDQDSVVQAAQNMAQFFASESCGQCTPCRVGCQKAVQLMQAKQWDKPLLADLATVMREGSICGLGQAASNPFTTVIRYFGEEV